MGAPSTSSQSEFVSIRGLRYHLRHWGKSQDGSHRPLLVMLHGWMDVSASFQFVADALAGDWHIVAPDWRGFGLTARIPGDTYTFFDYLGDLDALLDHISPGRPVAVLGHSMGGNAVMLYAGIRPGRISHVLNLEGFGMMHTPADEVPARYRRWLEEIREPLAAPRYDSLDGVVARLKKTNPRLADDRAQFLARHWAQEGPDGWRLLGDPRHKHINPVAYRLDEAMACWAAIEAPVLWVEALDSDVRRRMVAAPDYAARLAAVKRLQRLEVADAGHMVHHDQPELIAAAIRKFLGDDLPHGAAAHA
nr:alpha/beta hydrolase [Pigmentiphaga aceris]